MKTLCRMLKPLNKGGSILGMLSNKNIGMKFLAWYDILTSDIDV